MCALFVLTFSLKMLQMATERILLYVLQHIVAFLFVQLKKML